MTVVRQNRLLPFDLTASSTQLAAFASVSISLCLFNQQTVLGAETAPAPAISSTSAYTVEQIQELPQFANIKITAKEPRVVQVPPNVVVLVQAQSKEQDSDLKIDAMFIAKAVIEGTCGQTQNVKVVFSEDAGAGRYINISKKLITDFGTGKLAAEQLLSSLVLLNVHHEEVPKVAQGPEFERRLLDWQRMQRLKAGGTGTGAFEQYFETIEGLAKTGDSLLSEKLDDFESKLGVLEANVKQARNTASGRGIQGTVTHSPPAAAPPTTGGPGNSTVPATLGNNLPPDADRLKALFNEKSNSWVALIASKNSQDGQQARELKTQIEQSFAANKLGVAFYQLHLLQMMVQKVTGSDPFMPEGGPPGGGPGPGGQGGPGPGGPGGQGGPGPGGPGGQGGPGPGG